MLAAAMVAAALLARCSAASTTVRLAPTDCVPLTDCRPTIAAAINKCRASGGPCSVLLASGDYRVSCPEGVSRPSMAQTEHPAVLLHGVSGLTFGGDGGGPRPQLLVDYTGGGCAGISVADSADVTVRSLRIDPYRLPFTVGSVVSASANVVRIRPEADSADRAEVYAWDTARYPFLELSETGQSVARGERATRQLASNGLDCSCFGLHCPSYGPCYNSSFDAATGVVALTFPTPSLLRANLTQGTRVFLKHFGNEFSWGVFGWNVSGTLRVEAVSLYSTAGMGFRADFCEGTYELVDSDVSIKPGTVRPMSTTADATHWMHHAGPIVLRNSSMSGQGDDGFNIHSNFIVVESRLPAGSTVSYINEGGAGWVRSAPTFMIGDAVQFYRRANLQPIGERNTIVAATSSTVRFARPLPPGLKRYDMFLSMKRIASLEMSGCFFGNSNARGVVLSAVNATIESTTFANLSSTALLILEGGCGGKAGDYTEGPFSRNVALRNNRFVNTATVSRRSQALDINSLASVQIGGCTPLGVCGLSGGTLPPTASSAREAVSLEGGVLRVVGFSVPRSAVLSSLVFFAMSPPPTGVQMALYADTWLDKKHRQTPTNHPTKRLVEIASGAFTQGEDGWWRASTNKLSLVNGSYYLAHYFPAGKQWRTVRASGASQQWKEDWQGGFPPNLVQNWSVWNHAAGLAVAAEWDPKGDWCDAGGTLPPPTRHDHNSPNAQHLLEPGQLLHGGRTFARNIVIESNEFVAPLHDPFGHPWRNNHLHLGGIDGLTLRDNRLSRPGGFDPEVSGADIVVYSSMQLDVGGNTCTDADGRVVSCVSKNASSCGSITKC
jgi:hypothetical protein